MFWLEPGPLSATTTNVVYLCRPLVKWVKLIAGEYDPGLDVNHLVDGSQSSLNDIVGKPRNTLIPCCWCPALRPS